MEIKFEGKYKSITSFNWPDIPEFVVITGPNGTGKSQLLDLIHNTIINNQKETARVSIIGQTIRPNEITYLKGEWQLQNTGNVSLYTIQKQMDAHFNNFRQGNYRQHQEGQTKLFYAFQDILRKTGKQHNTISKEEFNENFPEILIEQESQISQ